ncbi:MULTISPECIES: hypothetical protein [Chitinophaga]|uniref:hypothetical protein n=1 Tax=Chitinophaga TaxID=79328 RepID=UPI001CED14CB|nr:MULTISPECIES: hypothetical protein [Chitinophaga]
MLCIMALSGCVSAYRSLRPAAGDPACVARFKPRFTQALYSTQVDVLKHHLSGLLFFKQMPDSSLRIVFTNEVGFKFFDFAFAQDGNFTKHYMMPKMDKAIIVNALRKDFELVLLNPDYRQAQLLRDSNYQYVKMPTEKGANYYITDPHCTRLERIEKSSDRKAVVKVWMSHYQDGVPDSICIQHQNFKFNISLQRVQQ